MSKPFLIRNPDTGVEFELADVAFFVREYQPQGFVIVDPAPMNYRVPDADEMAEAKAAVEAETATVAPKAEAKAGAVKKALSALPDLKSDGVVVSGGKLD